MDQKPVFDMRNLEDFTSLVVRIASPEDIRKWSCGEVLKPETINYRTLKSEKDGLFDERIFGPTKDWECYCGKYKRIRYKGVICDKCGVEVTQSRVRRERMGHISLACPVSHIWYFKGAPSRISTILGVAPRAIEQVMYFARYLTLSIDEDKKKAALKTLEVAMTDQEKEIITLHKSKKEILTAEATKAKEKIKSKIKNKEQLALALSEIELDERKKETAISEEEKANLSRNTHLFGNLISLAKTLKPLSILSEEEHDELYNYDAAGFFEAKMGAEAVLSVLQTVDLEKLTVEMKEEIALTKTTSAKYVKLVKRLKLADGMRRAKIKPEWMVLKVLPVLPPDLRPMVQLSGGRFATSDLNDLYRRVINRNNRLKHLMGLGAPEIILRNEKRMLQESVDSLIDTSQRKATRRARGRQPLRSLSDMLKGKQGRFRQNLLGKRVDYSGRSVIIVGPDLTLNQCGLPKEMALEMFKPFVLREMISRGIAPNVRSAKNMLDRRPPEVFDILEEITKDHPVLLNRAPTLHKLSIQAFYPVLIEGSAIRLHPAICSGFNADFDGDQMAVHVPLSKKAIAEAKDLMLPEQNLLRPSDGSPVSTPASKEMALGVYYLTSINTNKEKYSTIFSDTDEALQAYQSGTVGLRQKLEVRIESKIITTTIGRIMFNEILPDTFKFVNESTTSTVIKKIFAKAYAETDKKTVVKMIDAVKSIGFWAGTLSGISFGVFDAGILPEKQKILDEAEKKVSEVEQNYNQGLITIEEKKRMSQDVWMETSEDLADKTWALMEPTNPIRIVIDAKVGRASRDQVKQLSAIRGLVVDPMGKIVELPIKSNFREGLSVFEYVTSSRGSRKGLTDTALKTADAGYLTRRLVDVSHDLLIRKEDCKTKEGIVIKKGSKPETFAARIVGRYLSKDVKNSKGKVIAVAGEDIDSVLAEKISSGSVAEIEVRSALSCVARYGMCAKCYGWDLSSKKQVEIGTPVGVIAAQSIGEPGTQLTLRTKHSAGVVGIDVTQGLPRVEELVEARTPKLLSTLSEITGKVMISESEDGHKIVVRGSGKLKEEKEYIIPKTLELAVEDNQVIEAGTKLAYGPLDIKEVLSIKGLRAAQEYLVAEIHKVYETQGITINNKHFEAIVRKMSDEVKVVTSGDTNFLPGELTSKAKFEVENEKVLAAGGEPSSAQQVILGITRRSLYTESWLSAASFEQTTDVLTESSLMSKEDNLLGLKENVIIGRLIPVTKEKAILDEGEEDN
ncbi:DNA-directed RNA polymerase subunit beta' [Candidatus Microgenomates bacterium]|nr:DNA-directed RNA polymerase subunit beta' [Candidatus Microgenomates bacterium]